MKSMSRDNARDKVAHTCLLYDDYDDDYSCLSFREIERAREDYSTLEKMCCVYILHIVLKSPQVHLRV